MVMKKFLLLVVILSFWGCGKDIAIPSLGQNAALPNGAYNVSTLFCKSSNTAIAVVNPSLAAAIHHFQGTKTYTVSGAQFIETYTYGGTCTMTITRSIIVNKGNTLGMKGKTYDFSNCASGIRTESSPTATTFMPADFRNNSDETLYWMISPYSLGGYRLEGNVFDLQEFGCQIADQFVVILST
jgi:hypothetical protein